MIETSKVIETIKEGDFLIEVLKNPKHYGFKVTTPFGYQYCSIRSQTEIEAVERARKLIAYWLS